MYTLFHVFSQSCFISDIGVFFGAFLIPIILIMIFNVCIFISSSYVVIKLKINQQKRNQPLSNTKKKVPTMSSKDTCKLLALLARIHVSTGTLMAHSNVHSSWSRY